MDFQRKSGLIKVKKQISLRNARLLSIKTKSQIYLFIRPISMEHLQQTKGLRPGGIFLLLARQSNGESYLSNLSKRDILIALLIMTKLLFDFYTCHLFGSMYIPLFKFIIPIAFGDREIERNIFQQVCYNFSMNTLLSLCKSLYFCKSTLKASK